MNIGKLMAKNYKQLSKELENRIEKDRREGTAPAFAFDQKHAVRRRFNPHDNSTVWRTAFIRDVDKILNCPYYNRYADKTQVFSLYKNDDIQRRSLHVQLVSRIARTIGSALNLNLDLIESIALGHDLGHTPFGHTGERFLDKLYRENTGRRFNHNVHSVRVLDVIFPLNITLQTLDGVLAHNGELELEEYSPKPISGFEDFDEQVEKCYLDGDHVKLITPSTLEGCVVRISDIIAYLGKDRQDAEKSSAVTATFSDYGIGLTNAEIINNLIVNVLENSYGKPYIKMDNAHFTALKNCKSDNYDLIYKNQRVKENEPIIEKLMTEVYARLSKDLKDGVKSSPIFTHHIGYIDKPYYKRLSPYLDQETNDIVVDYIASMTDDYILDLYRHLFPKGNLELKYKGYFD